MKSPYFIIGFITGLILVAVIFTIIVKKAKKKGKKMEYDERQIALRGKAYQTGFKAFTVCEVLLMCYEIAIGHIEIEPGLLHFLVLLIGVSGFVIHSIWVDAYFMLNEKRKVWTILIIIAIIFNLFCGFMNHLGADGTNTSLDYINYFVAIFCCIILINVWAKVLVDKARSGKEE